MKPAEQSYRDAPAEQLVSEWQARWRWVETAWPGARARRRSVAAWAAWIGIPVAGVGLLGCSPAQSDGVENPAAVQTAAELPPVPTELPPFEDDPQSAASATPLASQEAGSPRPTAVAGPPAGVAFDPLASDVPSLNGPATDRPASNAPGSDAAGSDAPSSGAPGADVPGSDETSPVPLPAPEPRLRDDLSPAELVAFLASADEDMELIHSGRAGLEEPREIRRTLVQIVNRKLQAARQLIAHPEADAKAISEGKRGELQALSHLAALSDVRAARELEALAAANMSSDDPLLVADSRLVLIGFAIEALQNGQAGAEQQIVSYAERIAGSDSQADVPALIVLGQAKQALENYGYPDLARQVRDTIIESFGDSNNPDVAAIAAQIAGNVQFDGADKLRERILAGETVETSQWTAAVETLIDESADLQTVRYLAAAAVDFEAHGMMEKANATLNVLQARFVTPEAATTREVQTAVEATEARRELIGQALELQLPSVDGSPLDLQDYQGRVVLMPFWGMGIPLSLQPIPTLRSLRQSQPDELAIVGVNLDSSEAPLAEFIRANEIDFPSFSLAAEPDSTLPRQVGLVSMPFVIILDRAGRVAAVQLTAQNLRQTINRLIAESP